MFKMKLVILFVINSGTFCVGDENVILAAVIYRHGDRTPVDTYPTDPWRNESLWPVKFGELTNIGKQQHYALGKWLRQRYSHLLSSKFNPTEIYVRSTDLDRTLMSAQANLAGMYPPTKDSVWNKDLMWQPVPVHTVPTKEDEVLYMDKPCPAWNQEYNKVTTSKSYKDRLMAYQNLMDVLTEHTGETVNDYCDILNIYSTLSIESFYNFTLPDWTKEVFPNSMKDPAAFCFAIDTLTPRLARFKVGPLLKQITSKMASALNDKYETDAHKKHPKVLIFSGHDLTVANVLNALGLYDFELPVYTATVLIELVHDKTTPGQFIRISYRNSLEIVEPRVLEIPSCGKLCPLDNFLALYDNLLSVDWDYECEKQFPVLLGVSFLIGLILFGAIYVVHKVYFVRVSRQHKLNVVYAILQQPPSPTLQNKPECN